MDKINLLLFMMPNSIVIDPLATLALVLGFAAMFAGYLYKLTPPFMLRQQIESHAQEENAHR